MLKINYFSKKKKQKNKNKKQRPPEFLFNASIALLLNASFDRESAGIFNSKINQMGGLVSDYNSGYRGTSAF